MPAWKWLEIWLDFMLPAGLLFIGLTLARPALKSYRFRPAARCFKCGYDMHVSQSLTCPECGHTMATSRILLHGKIKKARLSLGLILTLPGVWVLIVLLLAWANTWPFSPSPQSAYPFAATPTMDHPDFNVDFETTSFATQLPQEQTQPSIPLPNRAFFWVHKIWDRATYKPQPENQPSSNSFSIDQGPASDEVLAWRAHQDVIFGFTFEPQSRNDQFCCTPGPHRPTGFTTLGYLLSPYLNPINHYQRYFLTQDQRLNNQLLLEAARLHQNHYAPPPDRFVISGRIKPYVTPATLNADLLKQIVYKDDVTEMTLTDLALSDSAIKQLHNFKNLKSLTLVRVYLSPAQLKKLGDHSAIQQLSIEQSESQPELDLTSFADWKNLRSLSIAPSTRNVWNLSDNDLAQLISLPRLERLYLRTSKVQLSQIKRSLAAARKRAITIGRQPPFVFADTVAHDDASELARLTGLNIKQ